jgi:hypothetical protein
MAIPAGRNCRIAVGNIPLGGNWLYYGDLWPNFEAKRGGVK